MMTKEKWWNLVGVTLVCIFISGCGSAESQANVQAGMDAITVLEYEQALAYFDAAEAAGENARLIARGKGIACMGMTDYEGAVSYFEQCLSYSDGFLQDVDFDVNLYLAAAYSKLGQYDRAEGIYDAILALHPGDGETYFLRGNAKLEQGNQEGAIWDFEQVIHLNSEDYDKVIDIYEVLAAHGMEEQGLSYLQQAFDDGETKMSAYDKGRIYYYLGDYQQACINLEEAKSLGTAQAYLYLGRSYEATGDYNYAITYVYQKYLQDYPADAELYNQLGLCYLHQEQYQEALSAFQSAMQIPDNGMLQTLQFNEVVAYEYLGQFTQAAALLNSYLQTYPDDQRAQREFDFLSTR